MIFFAVLFALAALGFIFWHQSRATSGWSAGPLIGRKNYSAEMNVDASGSFDFPTSSPGVHYVTKLWFSSREATGIRLHYRIDADPSVEFVGCEERLQVHSGPFLYFQRKGDDWSGTGKFEVYRWWASFAPGQLMPGEHEIIATFDENWTAVGTSNAIDNPAAFKAALANIDRVGFTFPNSEGLGHGLYASGPTRFVVLAFDLIESA